MNAGVKLGVLALITAPIAGLAEDQPKLSCKDFTYSQEFLAQYPKAGAACREVIMKDGQKWVRFETDIKKVNGNQATADVIDNHGNTVSTLTVEAAADTRVSTSKGAEKKFSQLKAGNKLMVWLPESKVGFYAAPGASDMEKLAVVKRTEAQR
jgi:hypothetical protein